MEEVCRVCMISSASLQDIFALSLLTGENNCSLAEIIGKCVNSELRPDDKLPKKICTACIRDAQNAFRFRQRYEESYRLLSLRVLQQEDENFLATLEAENWQMVQPGVPSIKTELQESFASNSTLESSTSINETPESDGILQAERERKINFRHRRKNHKCAYCGKEFVEKFDIIEHYKTHTGEKAYKCAYCPKSYSTSRGLKLHSLGHPDNHLKQGSIFGTHMRNTQKKKATIKKPKFGDTTL